MRRTVRYFVNVDDATRFERGTDGPRVIVVGIDGSPSSMRAAAYAAGLARRQGSTLVLVYVQQVPISTGGAIVAGAMVEAGEDTAEQLAAELREGAQTLGGWQTVRWEFLTRHGDPFHELVAAAKEQQADAVVVGGSQSRGHRIMGSIAVRLVRSGHWPVTVVP